MISVEEYKRRVEENTKEYNRQSAQGQFDLRQYHGFDTLARKATKCVLMKKPADILCAVILGFLPILTKNTGADAIRLDGIIFTPVELKSSFTDESKFIKTDRGTIYSASPGRIVNNTISPNNVTNLKSCYNATYSIKDNISLKGIDTYLVVLDSRNDDVIDCFCIPAEKMVAYFNSRKVAASGNLQIKLAEFMNLGKQFNTVIPMIGFEKWREQLLPLLPVVKVTLDDASKEKNKQKRRLQKIIKSLTTVLPDQHLTV